ncbi:acyl-CoA dehydrogenase family protein [Novosphingobium bradum]|uniref:Acyl-CoA dehydrogenase family protein n=1 Tax=Novosphingobium bradum TaxID=1737444 RepID=A0ABV7ILF9_9SPHN
MNFDDTPAEAAFRAEARAWLDANAPANAAELLRNSDLSDLVAESKVWQGKKAAAGYACLRWPTEYGGGGRAPIDEAIWRQEEGPLTKLGAVFGIGQGMCGPTVMHWASEEVRRERLPKLASGEEIWCQLFSEPSAGSDVAALRTRAEQAKDGSGDWIINGQKIWTSGAHYCDWGLLLARTDPTAPKHKGLTMFYVDMKSAGIEARPIRQANGQSEFNEVYFTDVRLPDSQRLGPVGSGWKVSVTTLMNERMAIGARIVTGFPEMVEFLRHFETVDGPALADRAVRSRLAAMAARDSGIRFTSLRAQSSISRGEEPGPENSVGKLAAGAFKQEMLMFALDLQGQAGALVDPAEAPGAGSIQAQLMTVPAMRIAGGTDEILRNIIAERVLGLPLEPRVDKDMPFNQIPVSGRGG